MISTRRPAACARRMSSSEPWVTLGRTLEASRILFEDKRHECFAGWVGGQFAGFLVLDMGAPLGGYIRSVGVARRVFAPPDLCPSPRGEGEA